MSDVHCNSSKRVISGTEPSITLKASLSRYLGSNSARVLEKEGAISDVLITAQHPAAIAPYNG